VGAFQYCWAQSGYVERREAMSESAPASDVSWRSIYILGGVSAVLVLGGTLFDIVLTSIPGWQASTVPTSVVLWLVQFEATPLLGLRNLDLLNITVAVVGLPMYVALYGVHRRTRAGMALAALVLVSVGTAVFVASNVALPMLELGRQYALASTDAQRLAIEGAATAMLARGSHGSAGVFAGFLLPSLGTLLMMFAMIGGRVFKRAVGIIGAAGTSLLLVYIVGTTFSHASSGVLMGIAGIGGVMMIVWYVLVARTLFRMGANG